MRELDRCAGSQFDSDIVAAFHRVQPGDEARQAARRRELAAAQRWMRQRVRLYVVRDEVPDRLCAAHPVPAKIRRCADSTS